MESRAIRQRRDRGSTLGSLNLRSFSSSFPSSSFSSARVDRRAAHDAPHVSHPLRDFDVVLCGGAIDFGMRLGRPSERYFAMSFSRCPPFFPS